MKRARMIRRATARRRIAHLDLHSKPVQKATPNTSTTPRAQ